MPNEAARIAEEAPYRMVACLEKSHQWLACKAALNNLSFLFLKILLGSALQQENRKDLRLARSECLRNLPKLLRRIVCAVWRPYSESILNSSTHSGRDDQHGMIKVVFKPVFISYLAHCGQ